jgi:hypothetical protein
MEAHDAYRHAKAIGRSFDTPGLGLLASLNWGDCDPNLGGYGQTPAEAWRSAWKRIRRRLERRWGKNVAKEILWIAVHEWHRDVGHHSHVLLRLPRHLPEAAFRELIEGAVGAANPGAVHVRPIEDRGGLVYVLKQFGRGAIKDGIPRLTPKEQRVLSARAPAVPVDDPDLGRQIVVCGALGPKARAEWRTLNAATAPARPDAGWRAGYSRLHPPSASIAATAPAPPAPSPPDEMRPAPTPPPATPHSLAPVPAAAPGGAAECGREWSLRIDWGDTVLAVEFWPPPKAWAEAERRLQGVMGQEAIWGAEAAEIAASVRHEEVVGLGQCSFVDLRLPRPVPAAFLHEMLTLVVEGVDPAAIVVTPPVPPPAPPDRPAPSPEPPAWRPAAPPAPSHTEPPSRPLPRPVAAFRPPGRHLPTLGALHPIHGPSGGLRARLTRLGIRGDPRPSG